MLLLVFGSPWAAALPVTLGIISVIVTRALIFLTSLFMHLSIFVTDAASLLGIGVAVDYSLILLVRVRQELRAASDFASAGDIALRTSGRAIAVSG